MLSDNEKSAKFAFEGRFFYPANNFFCTVLFQRAVIHCSVINNNVLRQAKTANVLHNNIFPTAVKINLSKLVIFLQCTCIKADLHLLQGCRTATTSPSLLVITDDVSCYIGRTDPKNRCCTAAASNIEKSLFRCSMPERPSNVNGLINLSLLSNFVAPNHMVPVVSVLCVLSGTASLQCKCIAARHCLQNQVIRDT